MHFTQYANETSSFIDDQMWKIWFQNSEPQRWTIIEAINETLDNE